MIEKKGEMMVSIVSACLRSPATERVLVRAALLTGIVLVALGVISLMKYPLFAHDKRAISYGSVGLGVGLCLFGSFFVCRDCLGSGAAHGSEPEQYTPKLRQVQELIEQKLQKGDLAQQHVEGLLCVRQQLEQLELGWRQQQRDMQYHLLQVQQELTSM